MYGKNGKYTDKISWLAYMIRDIKPAIYHEKYRKDIEKLNQSSTTAS